MNINDQLKSIFDKGVTELKIGIPKERPDVFFCRAIQGLPTGSMGHCVAIDHQTAGNSIVGVIESMAAQVDKSYDSLHKLPEDAPKSAPSLLHLPNNGRS